MEGAAIKNTNGRWKIFGLAIGLIVLALAAYGIQSLMNRPGEKALALVPANSGLFISLDLAPSPSQVGVFDQISEALKKYKLTDKIKEGLTSVLSQDPSTRSVAPYLGHGGAIAMLPSVGGAPANMNNNWVLIVGLTDPGKADAALSGSSPTETLDGMKFHRLHTTSVVAVIGNNLVTASTPQNLVIIGKVASGATKSVVDTPEYQAARSKLDADANMLVFMSRDAIKSFADATNATAKPSAQPFNNSEYMKGFKWLAYGVAVRDTGIAFSFAEGVDKANSPWFDAMSQVPPLRSDLLSVIPSGPYGVVATAGPGAYIRAIDASMAGYQGGKPALEAKAAFTKATHLDVDKDLIPALKGDAVFAMYPAVGGHKFPEMLLVMDDQNGGDPSAIVPKLAAAIETEWHKNNHSDAFFDAEEVNGVQTYRLGEGATGEISKGLSNPFGGNSQALDEQGQKDLQVAMQEMMKKQRESFKRAQEHPGQPMGERMDFSKEYQKAFNKIQAESAARSKRPTTPVTGTPYYALLGKTLVIASSKEMLIRAMNTYQHGQDSLTTDPLLSSVSSQVPQHSVLEFASISRIAKSIEEAMPKKEPMPAEARTYLDFFEALTQPVIFTGQVQGDMVVGTGLIPMKFGKLVELVAESISKVTNAQPMPGPSGNFSSPPAS
jgi:hypothetical protein